MIQSTIIKTNVGKIFLRLLKRHFPKENPLHKIFNKNTLKVSYSCMGNVAYQHIVEIFYIQKSLNLVAIVDQRPIAYLTTNAWLLRLFTKQMFETILIMRRNFTLRFLRHLLRSVSEIKKKNLPIRSVVIALNCQNINGNWKIQI